jgi:catechol 2,3-dioxygenase-like lactoylglutathione lyase family enzyme
MTPSASGTGRTTLGGGSHLDALCIDANAPRDLAAFWAEALRWEVAESPDEIGLVPSDGTRLRILFEPVPEPKQGQNRLHLDLTTTSEDDQQATTAQLIGLGARHVDIGQGPDERHVVLADPEGNEFCVIEPGNAFLADCGRLGSITCEGTQAVGYFWSEALGWPLVWDRDGETAIRSPDRVGPMITWSGGPIAPKFAKNRLHLDVAASGPGGQEAEVTRLVALGATPVDVGQGDVDWVVMADPDGNEFCVLSQP